MTEDEAVAALRGADGARASRAAAALWEMWCRSGRSDVDALLAEGIEAMEGQRLRVAAGIFDRLVALAPDFAEAWNKRATVRYLLREWAPSIGDCSETLARKPQHFGGPSGQGLCHLALGQHREAAALFRRALEVYPHLPAARQNLASALEEAMKGNGHT